MMTGQLGYRQKGGQSGNFGHQAAFVGAGDFNLHRFAVFLLFAQFVPHQFARRAAHWQLDITVFIFQTDDFGRNRIAFLSVFEAIFDFIKFFAVDDTRPDSAQVHIKRGSFLGNDFPLDDFPGARGIDCGDAGIVALRRFFICVIHNCHFTTFPFVFQVFLPANIDSRYGCVLLWGQLAGNRKRVSRKLSLREGRIFRLRREIKKQKLKFLRQDRPFLAEKQKFLFSKKWFTTTTALPPRQNRRQLRNRRQPRRPKKLRPPKTQARGCGMREAFPKGLV